VGTHASKLSSERQLSSDTIGCWVAQLCKFALQKKATEPILPRPALVEENCQDLSSQMMDVESFFGGLRRKKFSFFNGGKPSAQRAMHSLTMQAPWVGCGAAQHSTQHASTWSIIDTFVP